MLSHGLIQGVIGSLFEPNSSDNFQQHHQDGQGVPVAPTFPCDSKPTKMEDNFQTLGPELDTMPNSRYNLQVIILSKRWK